MDDAFFVRRDQRVGQGTGNLHNSLDSEAARGDQAIEWLPFEQLHGEKVDAVALFHGIERHDIRMIECGDGASLALEASETFGIARDVGRQDLKRNFATERGVGGAVYFTHSTGADRGVD